MGRPDETKQTWDFDKFSEIVDNDCQTLVCLSPTTLALCLSLLERTPRWASRWTRVVQGVTVRINQSELDQVQAWVDGGIQELMADCGDQFYDGLKLLADALSRGGGGGGGNCGGGIPGDLANLVGGYSPEDVLGPPGSELDEGTPPEGFETWGEYTAYKCDAAYYLWAMLRKWMVAFKGFDLVFLSSQFAGITIAGLAGAIPASLTPVGFMVILGGLLAIGALCITAWFWVEDMIVQWDTDQDTIICNLYNSGTSVEAVAAIGNAIEDAIQAITFSGGLEGVSGPISSALGDIFSAIAGNGFVAPLFEALASIVSVGYSCVACDAEAGDCQEESTLELGTGDVTGTGPRSISPELVGSDWKIQINLRRGTCVKVTAGPSAQLYQYHRCQGGSYSGAYKTQGAPDSVWSCCGKLVCTFSVNQAITIDLGEDTCDDEDTNCT